VVRFLMGDAGEGVDGGVMGVADLRERSRGGGVLQYRWHWGSSAPLPSSYCLLTRKPRGITTEPHLKVTRPRAANGAVSPAPNCVTHARGRSFSPCHWPRSIRHRPISRPEFHQLGLPVTISSMEGMCVTLTAARHGRRSKCIGSAIVETPAEFQNWFLSLGGSHVKDYNVYIVMLSFLDFKLSLCSEFCILSFG